MDQPTPERGGKPGFYVVVSRQFIADNERIETVVVAPVYRERLGLDTEVLVGPDEGIPHASSVRCDYLSLAMKRKLTRRVGRLSGERLELLDRALAVALDLAL